MYKIVLFFCEYCDKIIVTLYTLKRRAVMIIKKEDLKVTTESNKKGEAKLFLSNLSDFAEKNPKVRMFALAELKPGESVDYHVHNGESETYYILSGKALYNDNGDEYEALPGTVTFTPSGSGHGITNVGDEMLSFIALIVLD